MTRKLFLIVKPNPARSIKAQTCSFGQFRDSAPLLSMGKLTGMYAFILGLVHVCGFFILHKQ
jgi:hypothetical protein